MHLAFFESGASEISYRRFFSYHRHWRGENFFFDSPVGEAERHKGLVFPSEIARLFIPRPSVINNLGDSIACRRTGELVDFMVFELLDES